ncbi:hypothetical protein ACHQM5_012094 [Ranunculus cassubicifolius]
MATIRAPTRDDVRPPRDDANGAGISSCGKKILIKESTESLLMRRHYLMMREKKLREKMLRENKLPECSIPPQLQRLCEKSGKSVEELMNVFI